MYGAIPSPKDPRDYTLSMVAAVPGDFPDAYQLSPPAAVRNQYSSSMCVAFALAVMKRYQERREGVYNDYSPAFIYANRQESDWQGEGMIPREALERLRDNGVCRHELFPAIGTYAAVKGKITPAMTEDALLQTVETYVAVNTPAEVKTALLDLQSPVLTVVPVFAGWHSYQGGLLPIGVNADGYHAILIVGWRQDAWLVQNSWGTGWGEDGFGWLPMEYPIVEMWAVTDRIATKPARRIELRIGNKNALIDGESVMLDVAPIIKDGRTLVPLRFIGEAFGAWVDYDEYDQSITIVK